MLRQIIIAALGVTIVSLAAAQDTPQAEPVVVYKWKEGRVTHYSKQPPRGAGVVTRLDEQGLVISDDADDQAIFDRMRPMRPQAQKTTAQRSADSNTGNNSDNSEQALPEGTITKEQRCEQARRDIQVIQQSAGKTVNVEDENGNLVPMTDEQRQARLQNAQTVVDRWCN